MRNWSRHLAIAILIVLPFLYFNCSKMLPAIPPAGDSGNGFPGTPSTATGTFDVGADTFTWTTTDCTP